MNRSMVAKHAKAKKCVIEEVRQNDNLRSCATKVVPMADSVKWNIERNRGYVPEKLSEIKIMYNHGLITAKEVIKVYRHMNMYNFDGTFNTALFNAWADFICSDAEISKYLE